MERGGTGVKLQLSLTFPKSLPRASISFKDTQVLRVGPGRDVKRVMMKKKLAETFNEKSLRGRASWMTQ